MPEKQKERKEEEMDGEVIIVAVDASKEITDYALEWAVRNVTKTLDSIILLALLPSNGDPANRTNSFLSRLLRKWCYGERQTEHYSSDDDSFCKETKHDSFLRINNVCMRMMKQLCLAHNKQVQTQVKVVADAQLGSVATEARKLEATWVILDRRLKKEGDCCMKQLSCNIVIIDHAVPKVVRAVNPLSGKRFSLSTDQGDRTVADMLGMLPSIPRSYRSETNTSTLGIESTISDTDPTISWPSPGKKQFHRPNSPSSPPFLHLDSDYFPSLYAKSEKPSSFSLRKSSASPLDDGIKRNGNISKTKIDEEKVGKGTQRVSIPARRSADSPRISRNSDSPKKLTNRKYFLSNSGEENPESPSSPTLQRTSSIRKAISISMKNPPSPPPLCSICKHSSPIFGKTPRKFSYKEIHRATDGFSSYNLLADGGNGLVYKGILPDGQAIAVKQHKTLNAQGASEFCSEVEILCCAQHRNLVMLIGYCIEIEWLLIYEFACNGSLDKHLYGTETNQVMAWHNRMKVAIGAARGLRYLHEDCRVGCIVHRDFRPKNILLTHDFEPMVGDFGMARWQADGQSAEETRVIGALGYLAPEYTQTGLITEKADVYAFGVVLLELLSGIKATEFSRITGQQFEQEWGSPLLARKMINEIIDPRLKKNYVEKEVQYMMYAASLCIAPNPEKRPRMSKVLKILEGDISTDLGSNNGQHSASYTKQYVNNIFSTDSPISTLHGPSFLLEQSMHDNSTFMALAPFRDRRERSVQESSTSESNVSSEYQAYLQKSLTKFMKNFSEH